MRPALHIREVPDGLWITVSQPASKKRQIWGTVGVAIIGLLICGWYWSLVAGLVGSVIGGLLGFIISGRRRCAQLKAENFMFATKCNDNVATPQFWVVDRANIQSMYFDQAHGGVDSDPYFPEGLYADVGTGEWCLLPYVIEQQCLEVIEAIYKRFPDMPINARTSCPKEITTLSL